MKDGPSPQTQALGQDVPPIHGSAGVVYSDEEKAGEFAYCPELQCKPNFDNCDLDFIDFVKTEVQRHARAAPDEELDFITLTELTAALLHFNVRKAPGSGEIPNIALRHLSRKAMVAITAICNAAMKFRHFPKQWKEAMVVVIPKLNQNSENPIEASSDRSRVPRNTR